MYKTVQWGLTRGFQESAGAAWYEESGPGNLKAKTFIQDPFNPARFVED